MSITAIAITGPVMESFLTRKVSNRKTDDPPGHAQKRAEHSIVACDPATRLQFETEPRGRRAARLCHARAKALVRSGAIGSQPSQVTHATLNAMQLSVR